MQQLRDKINELKNIQVGSATTDVFIRQGQKDNCQTGNGRAINEYSITKPKLRIMKSIVIFLAITLQFVTGSYSQLQAQNNSIVLNGGYIVLDGGTTVDNISIVINQPNTSGILRLPTGGHIHSENQYNFVKWNTGTSTGNYVFPFGIDGNAADYIPFTFNKTVGNASVSASTWSTDQQNNPKPLLTNVAPVTNMSGITDSVVYAIDRFWDIQAPATTADLTFSYRGIENTTSFPTNLVQAQHWNGTSWDAPVGTGTAGVTVGIGTSGPIVGQNTFSPWVLIVPCSADTISQNPIICQGDSVVVGGNTYTVSNTYVDTLINSFGCDSIITTNLTVNPSVTGTDVQIACNSLTWLDGITYSASTTTPTFTIVGGSSAGCDSVVTLNLTVNPTVIGTDVQTVCNSLTWIDGITYSASTSTPTFTIVGGSAAGCDSVVTLNLTVNSTVTGTDVQTACNSLTWIDGITYSANTTTPTFTIVGGSTAGCDSVVTLNLTINTFASGTDVISSCTPITWIDGINYMTSTSTPTFTIVGGSFIGCDSIVTLNLTVNPTATGTDVQTVCNSLTWIDGITYSASTTTPIFTIVGGSAAGCDSIVTLNLTVNPTATSTDIQTVCNSLTWIDGITYSASTTTPIFTIVGGSSVGCDSVVTLNLTVNPTATSTDVQSVCNSLTWIDGITYTASTTTPTFTIVGGSSAGCDSVVTLNLTINTFASGTDVISSCTPIIWLDGITYSASTTTPTFTIVGGSSAGCDSVVTLNLTINTFVSGTDVISSCTPITWIDGINYTASTSTPIFTIVGGAASGCDSVVTLNLTVNPVATGTDVQTVCNSLIWIDGVTYSANTTTPTFTIVGGSSAGCDSVVTLNLTVIGVNAVINATPTSGPTPLNVFFGNGSTTGATITYNWDFGDGSTDTIFEPSNTYGIPGSYIVTLIVTDGVCSDTAWVTITTEIKIKVPSGFSPNGDGINDEFVIEGIDQYPDNKLVIYNRWGSVIFSAQPYKNNWKGQSEGKAILTGNSVTDGTFFYLLELDKETEPLTGYIEFKTK